MSDGKREVTKTKESAVKPPQPLTLLEAIQANERKTVQKLVESGVDLNAKLKGTYTALEIAALNKTSDIFEYLLSQNPKLPDILCNTIALHSPWETPKKAEILALLQDKGATPLDPLLTAATLGDLEKIKESKAHKYISSLVWYAVVNGKINIIEWLLTQDNISNESIEDSFKMVVLNGQLNAVQWILEKYPEPFLKNTMTGKTIIFYAAGQSKPGILEFLLSKLPPEQKNAYLHQKDSYCARTPLLEAVDKENLEAIKCLIAHGANIEDKDKNGNTALFLAIEKGCLEVVKWILTMYPTKIHEKDVFGMTPLHRAAKHNQLQVLQYLITEAEKDPSFSLWEQSDAKSTLTDRNWGGTPLHWAAEAVAFDLDVVKWLVTQYPQNIDSVDNVGMTPLQRALKSGSIQTARYLIANGASLHHKNQRGENALATAIKWYADTFASILIGEFGADPTEIISELDEELEQEERSQYLTLYRNYFIKQKNEIYRARLENSLETEVILDLRKIISEYVHEDMNDEEVEAFRNEINAATEKLLAPLKAHIGLGAQKPYKHKALAQQFLRGISAPPCNPLTVRRAVIALFENHPEIKGSEFAGILNNMLEETRHLKESTEKQIPEAKELPLEDTGQQRNALLMAIKSHDAPKAKALLEKYPELYQADTSDNTPLSYAAAMGQIEILRFLLSHLPKAEIHRKNKDGNTPLLLAVMNSQIEAMYLLLENGANVKDKNNMGMSVFSLIVQNEDHDTAQWLFSSRNTGISVATLIQPLKNHFGSIIPYSHKELSRGLYETISDQKNILTIHHAVDEFRQKHKETIKDSEFEKILDKMIKQTSQFCDPKVMSFSALADAVGWFGSSPSVIGAPAIHQTTVSAPTSSESNKEKATRESAVPK